jgi:uncharacterized protein YdaU (DUF1376 family)
MPSGRPWYQRNPADFIMAVRGWELELVGAYSLIIDHLNDRDRPLPNDDKFMAGLLHCSAQRWRKLRDELIARDKIYITPEDYISNPRFDREHANRFRTRAEAVEFGRAGGLESAARRAGQTELDLDPQPPERARARTRLRSDSKSTEKSPKIDQHSANSSARSLSAPATKTKRNQRSDTTPPSSPVRARQSPELREEEDSTHPNSESDSREGRLANADLKTLYDEVCAAAGICLVQPGAIDRAMTQVEKWRDLGCDFDDVVLPAIRVVVLSTDEPTRTLARFNARVLHEHAKRKAAARKGESYEPPQIPHLSPEGEDPQFFALRTELLDRVGPSLFCLAFNGVTFEDVTDSPNGRPLRILGPDFRRESLRGGDWGRILASTARIMGFTEIW